MAPFRVTQVRLVGDGGGSAGLDSALPREPEGPDRANEHRAALDGLMVRKKALRTPT